MSADQHQHPGSGDAATPEPEAPSSQHSPQPPPQPQQSPPHAGASGGVTPAAASSAATPAPTPAPPRSGSTRQSLSARLRSLIGGGPTSPTRSAGGSGPKGKKPSAGSLLTDLPIDDIVSAIGVNAPRAQRLDRIRKLCEQLEGSKLQTRAVEQLWLAARDLVQSEQLEAQQHALRFLTRLIQTQIKEPNVLRAHFFQVLHTSVSEDNVQLILEAMSALTRNGTDLSYFEAHIGPFLVEVLSHCVKTGLLNRVLSFIREVFEHGFGVLDVASANTLILCVSHACSVASQETDVQACLDVLQTVPVTPVSSLQAVVGCICRTICIERFSQQCVAIARSVLNQSAHHAVLGTTCMANFLKQPKYAKQVNLLSGAVVILTHASWGNTFKVKHIVLKPEMLLPCFLNATMDGFPAVNFEIARSLKYLITEQGKHLTAPVWDLVFDALQSSAGRGIARTHPRMGTIIDGTLACLEALYASGEFEGDSSRLFHLVELYPGDRDMSTALEYKRRALQPSEPNWLDNASDLLSTYFHDNQSPEIRLKVLSIVEDLLESVRHVYDDELMSHCVLATLQKLEHERHPDVLRAGLRLLVKLAATLDSHFEALMETLESLYENSSSSRAKGTAAVLDMRCLRLVDACIELFYARLARRPAGFSLRVYRLLFQTAIDQLHSARGHLPQVVDIQARLGAFFSGLRWGSNGYLLTKQGVPSSFVSLYHQRLDGVSDIGVPNIRCGCTAEPRIDLASLVQLVCEYLQEGPLDWRVKRVLLPNLAGLLQLGAPELLRGQCPIAMLCEAICTNLEACSKQATFPPGYDTSPEERADDIQAQYSCLASITVYKMQLGRAARERLLSFLIGSLKQHTQAVIRCLTAFALELEDSVSRTLPSILNTLQQFKSSKTLKLSLLELLLLVGRRTGLTSRLSFLDFKSIFAIALDTCCSTGTHAYLRALAFNVIAVWFLKVDIEARKSYVTYITDSLLAGHPAQAGEYDPMVESCLDLMARYAYDDHIEKRNRRRPAAVEALLANHRARSWVQGNTIITICAAPSGWAEVAVRNSSGNVIWVQRLQNTVPYATELAKLMTALGDRRVGELGEALDAPMFAVRTSDGASEQDSVHEDLHSLRSFELPKEDLMSKPIDIPQTQPWRNSTVSESDDASPSPSSFRSNKGSPRARYIRTTASIATQTTQADILREARQSWSPGIEDMTLQAEDPAFDQKGDSVLELHKFPSTQWKRTPPSPAPMFPLSVDYDAVPAQISDDRLQQQLVMHAEMNLQVGSPEMGAEDGHQKEIMANMTQHYRIQHTSSAAKLNVTSSSSPEPAVLVRVDEEAEPGESKGAFRAEDAHTLLPGGDQGAEGEGVPAGAAEPPSSPATVHALDGSRVRSTVPSADELTPRRPTFPPTSPASPASPASEASPTSATSPASSPDTHMASSVLVPGSPEPEPVVSPRGTRRFMGVALDPLPVRRSNSSELGPVADAPSDRRATAREVSRRLRVADEPSRRTKSLDTRSAAEVARLARHAARRSRSSRLGPTASTAKAEGGVASPKLSQTAAVQRSFDESDLPGQSRLGPAEEQQRRRPRSKTMVLTTEASRRAEEPRQVAGPEDDLTRFLFLQFHHRPFFGSTAVPLQAGASAGGKGQDQLALSLKILDAIPSLDTHKIGVVYMGKGQTSAGQLLSNSEGSARYVRFLRQLGELVSLEGFEGYTGGLDSKTNTDGHFALYWAGDITEVMFHVATMMPTKTEDGQQIGKKMHIGNDHVTIVFNDSDSEFQRSWLAGAVNFVYIVVRPLGEDTFRVTFNVKEGMEQVVSAKGDQLVSGSVVGLYVRQLAIHANLASLAHRKHLGNWLQRLKQIKKIKARFGDSAKPAESLRDNFTFFL